MERNLYAPPAAPVADPVETLEDRPRPWQVVWAVWLLWVSFAIGLLAAILQSITLFTFEAVLISLLSNGIRYLLTAWVNIKVSQGRNWARILILLWMLVALALVAFRWREYPGLLASASLDWVPTTAKFVLDCVALVLLFTPTANRRFKQP
jgi:hypothetical protein